MAATTNRNHTAIPDIDAATERAREANDRITEAGRKDHALAALRNIRWCVAAQRRAGGLARNSRRSSVGTLRLERSRTDFSQFAAAGSV